MKNIKLNGKRLLALLLAVVMVVGQVPFGATATDGEDEQAVFNGLQLVMSVSKEVVEKTVGEDETPVSTTYYTYSAKVFDGEGKPLTQEDGVEVVHSAIGEGIYNTILSNGTIKYEHPNSKYTVHYMGLELVGVIGEEDIEAGETSAEKTVEWKITPSWNDSTVVLAEEYPVTKPKLGDGCSLSGAAWVCTSDYVVDGKAKVIDHTLVGQEIVIAKYDLKSGETVLETVEYKATVDYADVDADSVAITAVNAANENGWYTTAPQKVIIKATADAKYTVDMLRPFEGHAWKLTEVQAIADKLDLFIEHEVSATDKVELGVGSLEIKIDTTAPVISNTLAYVNGEKVHVIFDVADPESEITSVTVNGDAVTVVGGKVETDIVTTAEKLDVVAVNGAGTSATAQIDVVRALSVTLDDVASDLVFETIGTTKILKDTATIGVNVFGDVGEVVFTSDPAVVANKVTIAKGTDLNNFTVSVKDSTGREANATAAYNYAFDAEKPTISVTKSVEAVNTVENTHYFNQPVTYTVKITDNYAYASTGSYEVSYMLGNKQETITGAGIPAPIPIEVPANTTMTGLKVTATDGSGNAAETYVDESTVIVDTTVPVIKAEITGVNVTKFYENGGKHYAYLETPVVAEDAEAITATIVFTLEETYPDAEQLKAQGWDNKDGAWTYSKDVTIAADQTKILEIVNLSAIDMAKNIPTANISIKSSGSESVGYVTELVLEPTAGAYSKTIYFDRRRPTTGDADKAPVITLKPVVSGAVKELDSKFNGSFNYTMTVYDHSELGDDSGVDFAAVTWSLSNNDGIATTNVPAYVSGNEFVIPINVVDGVEQNGLSLTVVVPDKVGNTYTYTTTFGVDTKTPVIVVTPVAPGAITEGAYYNQDVKVDVKITDLNLVSTEKDITIVALDNEDHPIEGAYKVEGANGNYTVTFSDTNEVPNGHVKFDLSVNNSDAFGHPSTDDTLPSFEVYKDQSPVTVTVDAGTTSFVDLDGTRYFESNKVTITAEINDGADHYKKATMSYTLDDGTVKEVPFDKTTGVATFTIADQLVLTSLRIDVTNIAGTTTTAVSGADWLFGDNTVADVMIAVDNQAPQFSVKRSAVVELNDKGIQVNNPGYIQTLNGVDYFNGKLTYDITVTDKFLTEKAEEIVIQVNGKDVEETVERTTGKDTVTYQVVVDDANPLNTITVLVKDINGKTAVIASDVDEVNNLVGNEGVSCKFDKSEDVVKYAGNKNIVDTKAPEVSAEIFAVGDNGKDYTVENFYYDGEKFYAYITPVVENFNFLKGEADNVFVTLKFSLTEANPDAARLPAPWVADEDGNWTYSVETKVAKDSSALIEFEVPVVDMADNIPNKEITIEAAGKGDEDKYHTAITLSPVAVMSEGTTYGAYVASLNVDRITPAISFDGEIDKLEPTVKPVASVNGQDLFNESFSFQLEIDDKDSGVKSVNWSLEGEQIGSFIAQTENKDGKVSEDGKYTIPVTIVNGAVSETDDVTLKIVITDFVNNVYTFVKTFSVDNKDPQVSVVKTNAQKAYIQTIGNVDYYNDVVNYSITASDLFMKDGSASYVLDGKEYVVALTLSEDKTTYTGSLTVNSNETLSDITFSFVDYAADANHYHYANVANTTVSDPNGLTSFADGTKKVSLNSNDVVVDMDAPVVEITLESEDKTPVLGDGVTYYQNPVTYTVKVTDEFLTDQAVEGQTQVLTLNYTKENQEKVTIALPTAKDGWKQYGDTYTYSFTVAEGEVLTGMTLEVYDNAGNAALVAPTDFEIKNNVVTYVGDTVVVDGTNAEILVEKTVNGKYIQAFDGNDYYDGEVTYNFTITDSFLINDAKTPSKVLLNVTYLDGTKMDPVDLLANAKATGLLSNQDQYTTSFTVKDGMAVKDIQLVVIDNAGNISTDKNVTVKDTDERTTFKSNGETIGFTGLPFIVDMTKPEATLEVKGNVTQYYTNKDGVLFVKLDPVASGNSGELVNPADYQTVELVLTVNDKNLTLEKNAWPIVSNNEEGGAWTYDVKVNADSTVTYTKTIQVKTDEVGVITMDVDVFDLAANALTIKNIVYKDLNNTVVDEAKHIFFSEDGKFMTKVSVDRRRVTSLDDNQAPVILITPADSSMKTTGGIDLYNGAFTITMDVTDGEAGEKNSGIDYVNWTVEDKGVNPVVVNAADNSDNVEDDVHKASFQIPVALNGAGESNDVFVTIIAVDNVGNETMFQKQIAVDNLAPRVKVTYDNNNVRNEKYFKEDRVATITITDINLNPEQYAVVETTGAASGWTYDGTVGTSSVSFTVEGEHKFSMNCTDLAANHTADEAVVYEGEAVREFILDKTRPVINVTFNPSTPAGRDTAGVNYYDQDQNVTVTVRDEYFDSRVTGSVNANMGNGYNLGAFFQNGTNHTASVRYTEGNNYSFNVTVTDLAGNVSDVYNSETFSVDVTAPTIVISQGNLTNDELNIVQKDLVLGFTINDAQNNLSSYSVKLTHLNNEFQETVVEGADYYVVNDSDGRTTVYVTFDSIDAIKANDGTYNVQISATDYAGHHVTLNPSLNFSLNRFGSTFMTDDEFTAKFLEPSNDGVVYQNAVSNKLIIKEINPNKVWQDDSKTNEGSVITIAVNGKSIILEKGKGYTVTMTEEGTGSNKWYVYTYEIDPSNFLDGSEQVDGNYTVLLYGVDDAGNKNTNESNEYSTVQKDGEGEYSGKITFTLDHKAPVITTYGVETGDSIDAEYKQLNINLSDNTPASIKVLVNGVEVPLSETMEGLANNQLWLAKNDATGEYVLNIPESNEKRTITIITTDAAGNVAEQVVDDVLITSNAFIRAINNPWVVGGFITGLLAIILFIIFTLKKKKNKAEQAA